MRDVFLVLEEDTERPIDRGFVELAGTEGGERHRPIERLRDTGPLEKIVTPKCLDHRDDASREPDRHFRKPPRDDRQLALDAWIVDPLVEAPTLERVVDLSRAI